MKPYSLPVIRTVFICMNNFNWFSILAHLANNKVIIKIHFHSSLIIKDRIYFPKVLRNDVLRNIQLQTLDCVFAKGYHKTLKRIWKFYEQRTQVSNQNIFD